jgi:RNA polymerase sigma factor (sigma-70 family)
VIQLGEQAHQPSPELRQEARAELERLARKLPRDELELLVLQRLDGLTQAEMAEVTGRSPRTIRRLLARCEARLPALRAESLGPAASHSEET